MSFAALRSFCATLPGATMDVKWGADEVWSVGGKMFAIFSPLGDPAQALAFKAGPARFLELTDIPGVVPAPYLARAHWVQVRDPNALPRAELRRLVAASHAQVLAGLTRKAQAAIAAQPTSRPARAPRRAATPKEADR